MWGLAMLVKSDKSLRVNGFPIISKRFQDCDYAFKCRVGMKNSIGIECIEMEILMPTQNSKFECLPCLCTTCIVITV